MSFLKIKYLIILFIFFLNGCMSLPGIKESPKKQKINKKVLASKYSINDVGINKYPTDPTDPRSWGSPEDASKWFVETELSKDYFQELAITSKKINEKYL